MKTLEDLLRGIKPPTFDHGCPTCGTLTTRPGQCPACADAKRLELEAKQATAASMPKRFAWTAGLDATALAACVDSAALEQARAMDVASLDRATLLGSAGAGKTSLASALAVTWAGATARTAVFVAAVDVGVARQQHGLGEGEPRIVRQAMNAPLLVLDDLGQEAEVGIPVVAHILQHRYNRAIPTIATSGLTIEQLVSRYGAGVARRLLETVGGVIVIRLRTCRESGAAR
jgi:DNA replication protein DnaC